jgi:hypothetical protein
VDWIEPGTALVDMEASGYIKDEFIILLSEYQLLKKYCAPRRLMIIF